MAVSEFVSEILHDHCYVSLECQKRHWFSKRRWFLNVNMQYWTLFRVEISAREARRARQVKDDILKELAQ